MSALHFTIVDLRARLDAARQRVAAAEARIDMADSFSQTVGSMLLEAHDQLRRERQAAEAEMQAMAAAVERTAGGVLASAFADAARATAAFPSAHRPTVPAAPAAQVLAFAPHADEIGARSARRLRDEQIA